MNLNKPTHDALVEAIYESALNPVKWKEVLNQLSVYHNASAINMIGVDVNDFDNPFLLSQNLSGDYGKDYKNYWREHVWVRQISTKVSMKVVKHSPGTCCWIGSLF